MTEKLPGVLTMQTSVKGERPQVDHQSTICIKWLFCLWWLHITVITTLLKTFLC